MELHKPKPVHSWRELLSEIGVIVIGVLIALTAEQAVEWLHWREKTAQARETLRDSAQNLLVFARERVEVAPCLEAQLDRMKQQVLAARGTLEPLQRLPDSLASVYFHPIWTWDNGTWQSIVSDNVPAHFDARERDSYTMLFAQARVMDQLNNDETAAGGDLMVLTSPIEVDAGVKAHLIEIIERERERVGILRFFSQLMIKRIDGLHILTGFDDRAELARRSKALRFCRTNHLG